MSPVLGRRDRTSNWMLWQKKQNKGFPSIPEWQSEFDQRRKLVQVVDKYEVLPDGSNETFQFVVTKPYYWVNYLYPKEELDIYVGKVIEALKLGGWQKKSSGSYERGDLVFNFKRMEKHPMDILDKRDYIAGYEIFEASVTDGNVQITEEQMKAPWNAVRASFRKIQNRGNPTVAVDTKILEDYFPCQVQLGAGASIDSGVLPLHVYHDLYSISDLSLGKTRFDINTSDTLTTYLSAPEQFWKKVSKPYLTILMAKPNALHYSLKVLKDAGKVVGPIITSNYDGLPYLLGMDELFVRKLAASHRSEMQNFDPSAKSLLVVGEHADRRFIQRSARNQGLKIIYVDPEGFYTESGFCSYPLESIKDSDILFKMRAKDFGELLDVSFVKNLVEPVRGHRYSVGRANKQVL